jgi:hypothetical protein
VQKQTLLAVLLLCGLSPFSSAVELRTYTLADNQDRLFHYAGGLLGIDLEATLSGSFDVELDSSGQGRITRFDLKLFDIVNHGMHPVNLPEGTSLAETLFVDPEGLLGWSVGATLQFGEPAYTALREPILDSSEVILSTIVHAGRPTTLIQIHHRDDGWAEIQVGSDTGFQLDAPSMSTGPSGFLAQVVPEPAAAASLLAGVLGIFFAAGRHRQHLA